MFKALLKYTWVFIFGILEWVCRIIYLMLPLGFHLFALQMRKRINPVTTLQLAIDENCTWTMAYDGLIFVNTNVGAVRKRFKLWKDKMRKLIPLWVTLAVGVIIALLVIIVLKLV